MTTAQTHSLGTLLRRYRMAARLTQEELAARAGVSARTISDLERGLTRRSHVDTLALLAEALGLAPDERVAFEATRRPPRQAATTSAPAGQKDSSRYAVPAALVPLTPIVGREREEAAAVHLMRQDAVRLLTLTGPAGVGKTRLALQVATALDEAFADGVCFVALAPVREPRLVSVTIAQALGPHDASSDALTDTLAAQLADKRVLLVLDNFEQVVAAAPEVAALLAACPQLKALATSRATLRVRGEQELAVSPLALPDVEDVPALDTLGRYAAVALFVQRARAARPTFALTEANAAAVATICRRLDGLPLAIELAAPRVKLFSPQALLKRLDHHRMATLTDGAQDMPERHRSLQSAIAWSYDLLDAREQMLFRRLSVFVGGWTMDAAEAVCRPAELGLDIVEGVSSLVDKSLVQQQDTADDEPRFGILETMREFGLERLNASGEVAAAQRRHAQHYLALAEAAEPELMGPEQATWLAQLEAEHGNLRAVLQWARESGEIGIGVRLAAALYRFWRTRALREGRGWLEDLLALDSGTGEHVAPAGARSKALNAASYLAYVQGDLARVEELAQEHRCLCEQTNDQVGFASALLNLGNVRKAHGDYEGARRLYEEALVLRREQHDLAGAAIILNNLANAAVDGEADFGRAQALYEEALTLSRSAGDRRGTALVLLNVGCLCLDTGDYEQASAYLTESLKTSRELEDSEGVAHVLESLGALARRRNDFPHAVAALRESLQLFQMVGSKRAIPEVLEELAAVWAAQSDAERAVRLYVVAETLRNAIGLPRSPVVRPDFERAIADLRGTLGEARFAEEWAGARALSLEQALAEAMAEAMGETVGAEAGIA